MEQNLDDLVKQLHEKEKIISDLKEKTKSYIVKLQTQHQEALLNQQELTKDAQVSLEDRVQYASSINLLIDSHTGKS